MSTTTYKLVVAMNAADTALAALCGQGKTFTKLLKRAIVTPDDAPVLGPVIAHHLESGQSVGGLLGQGEWVFQSRIEIATKRGDDDFEQALAPLVAEVDAALRSMAASGGSTAGYVAWDHYEWKFGHGLGDEANSPCDAVATLRFRFKGALKTVT